MKYCFVLLLMLISNFIIAQRIAQTPDTVREKRRAAAILNNPPARSDNKSVIVSDDSQIKEKLIALAFQNPAFTVDDANIRLAELSLTRAKSSLLGSLSAGANFNEFAISKSPVASYYPKYNIGLSVPFNLFAKSKNDKKVADQNIVMANAQKESRKLAVKAEVLTRYENYKEQKEIVRLQKISIEEDYSAYLAAQKNYSDGLLKLDEMNKVYQTYTNEQAKLISRQKDLNVAVIQLEEMIGVPLTKVIPNPNK